MINNLKEAEILFESLLFKRDISYSKKESTVKFGNSRYYSDRDEIYHLKFTKKPFMPDPDKYGPARELHLKLHYAIGAFQYRSLNKLNKSETGTMVGIDEDLLLFLMNKQKLGYNSYIITILAKGIALWISGADFYSFTMRYDTFIKFPKSGTPVCYVPTGYFLRWDNPFSALPIAVS